MNRLFNFESPLMQILNNVADLIVLNFIWLICCIPVITIGPASAAMCCVARGMAKGDWPPVLKTFFKAFRSNFKQAIQVSLVLLIPVCLLGYYLLLAASGGMDDAPMLKYLSWLAIAVIGIVCSYAYPLLAHFDNTVGNTLKNAVILPLANPVLALIVTGLNLLPILLLLINAELLIRFSFFWVLIGCALTAYINARLLGSFFQKLAPPEDKPE